jgi:predicted Kef-type K+ transport protein
MDLVKIKPAAAKLCKANVGQADAFLVVFLMSVGMYKEGLQPFVDEPCKLLASI